MSILIVDDSNLEKKVLQDFLDETTFDAISVGSAEEAFDVLGITSEGESISVIGKSLDLEAIFMDYVMPGLNGVEACRVIKQSQWKDVPIIMITSVHEEDIMESAFEVGVMDFLTKPVNKVELLARLRAAINFKKELDARREYEQKLYYQLNLAKGIQQQLLSADFKAPGISVSSYYKPSDFLSGDMYYLAQISKNVYGILIFSVSGKGIPASLISIFISSVAQEVILNFVKPNAVMQELNQRMCEFSGSNSDDGDAGSKLPLFFSALYLTIDTAAHQIEYINASHVPGVLHMFEQMDKNNLPETVQLSQGPACLGLFEDLQMEQASIKYAGPSRLVLSSDGLVESMGASMETGLRVLTKKIGKSRDISNTEMASYIMDSKMAGDINDKDICLIDIALDMD